MNNTKHSKIMIVDDEPVNVKLLTALLREFDYDIHGINDSEQAFAKIEDLMPDLVLLDVQMPHINGLEIAKQMGMNERTKNIPIIFVSARNDIATIKDCLKHNAIDFITKPINFNQLTTSVQKALALKNAQS